MAHREPKEPVEVVVTGVHLTFDNIMALVVMILIAQLAIAIVVGAIVGILLYSFDVI